MLAILFVLSMTVITRCDISLPELEFLVGQMSFSECQHLADALRLDMGSKNIEGVTCLDELIRVHYALNSEGPNIVRGVFKHNLNQIGRHDLAQWLSIEKQHETLTRSKKEEDEQVPIEGKGGPLETATTQPVSWCKITVTIALLYTGALLVWLTVRVVLCKMKKHCRENGLAASGNIGYEYYPTPEHWPAQWSRPNPLELQPGPQWGTFYQTPPSHHHHHHREHHNHHQSHPLNNTASQPLMKCYE